MKIDVDVDQLRESLLDRAGSAAGVGFPAAMLDVVDIEDESPQPSAKASTSATLPSPMRTTVTIQARAGNHNRPSTPFLNKLR